MFKVTVSSLIKKISSQSPQNILGQVTCRHFVTSRKRDLEACAMIGSNLSQFPDDHAQSVVHREHALVNSLESLSKVDLGLKKILSDYIIEFQTIRHNKFNFNQDLAQKLFECNEKVKDYLTKSQTSQHKQNGRFLNLVNSELVEECGEINNLLQRQVFSSL